MFSGVNKPFNVLFGIKIIFFRGLITAIATFQKDGATGGTFFIGFIVVCVATGFVICALGDFFMLAKVP
jgi:hypothetical protein